MTRSLTVAMLGILLLIASVVGIVVVVEPTTATIGHAAARGPSAKLSHGQAVARFERAGLPWRSSGNCTDRRDRRCTSFSRINENTVKGIIAFRNDSGCDLMLTGGTETGHSDGTYSHWNGHKIDFSPNQCAANHIRAHYSAVRVPQWGSEQWTDRVGNLYTNEDDHWDITYY